MKNYKNFIIKEGLEPEQATKQATEITYDEFYKYIWDSKHFGDRVVMSDDKPIYRSIDLRGQYYYVDPSIPFAEDLGRYYIHDGKKFRKSAYTSNNHYTLLINHLPSYSEFPKREVICSSVPRFMNDTIYRLIPLEDIKIGIVPSHDIQDIWESEFEKKYDMVPYTLNDFYYINNISCKDWDSFVKYISEKKYGDDIEKEFSVCTPTDPFYPELFKLLFCSTFSMTS